MAKIVIEVAATKVRHDVSNWISKLNKEIESALKTAEGICQSEYYKFTNKMSGTRIRSTHISKMLKTESQEVRGAKKGKAFEMQAYLDGDSKWVTIAEKQEIGGVIRPKRSKLLTIPNIEAGVSPYARARHFGNRARWEQRGGTPVLVRGSGRTTKPRSPKKPISVKRRNAPRKRDMPQGNDILFWGVKSVYLKPKRFFEDSMAEAARVIEKELSNRLSAVYRRVD